MKTMIYKKGQSLIEVVIALAVVVALAISLVTASLITQKTSRSATSNTEATKLVQENIEQIRVFRDRKGFSALTNSPASGCTGGGLVLVTTNSDPLQWTLSNSLSTPSVACPETKTLGQTNFSRKLTISDPASASLIGKQKKVVVTVSWMDSSGTQSVSNDTVLSNCVSSTETC